jgi:hypothetical protein
MKKVLLLILFASFAALAQKDKQAAAPKAPATPVTKTPVRAAKYEVLYGSKPLSKADQKELNEFVACLLYTSPSPRD